jgi:hypothetical protein
MFPIHGHVGKRWLALRQEVRKAGLRVSLAGRN